MEVVFTELSDSNTILWIVTGISAVVHLLIHRLLARKISEKLFSNAYGKLTSDDKSYWDASVPASVNGIMVGLLAVVILIQGDLKLDPIWGTSLTLKICGSMGMGYFITDTYEMSRNFKVIGSQTYIIHHIVVVLGYAMILVWGNVGYFVALRSLCEFTQPFAFSRWALSKCGLRNSDVYFYNGLCFLLLFFFTRIAIMPFYYASVYSVIGTDGFDRMNLFCKSWFILSTVSLDILNLYWFVKIMKGSLKVIKERFSKAS